ncbi:hypothetical protein ACXYTP_23305 [Tsukamurella ocularis]
MTADAPAGIPPLVWLVIFLLVGPPALLSKTAARAPGILGAAARWWHNREPATASYRVSQAEIKRLTEMYEAVHEDYDELAKRLDRIEAELTTEKRLRWDAIGYIRVLIDHARRHAPGVAVPDPPERLRDLV